MAELITDLSDDDIRTEWAGSPTVSAGGDDDTSDTAAGDEDAADAGGTGADEDASDSAGADQDTADA